jgi:hypothetical protein
MPPASTTGSAPVQALPAASAATALPPTGAGASRAAAVRKPVPPAAPQRPSGAARPADSPVQHPLPVSPAPPLPEPAPTAVPVPVPAPTAAQPADPNEVCGKRILLAYHRCMLRECERPVYAGHPECRRVRAIEERRPGNFNQ